MNTRLDRPSELEEISEMDETEGDKWMDIDDDETLNVEHNENENFIDYVTSNDLIKDNWDLDVSNIDDSNSIDEQAVYVVLKKCRSFVNIIRKSSIISNYFDQLCIMLSIKRRLSSDCITRWNSTYHLIDSFISLKTLIMKFFADKYLMNIRRDLITKLIYIELLHDDWQLLMDLRTVLKPFDLATKLMSSRSYPTIGLCYYAIQKLHIFLGNDEYDRASIKSLKYMLLLKFEHYFDSDQEQLKLLKVMTIIE